MGIGLGIALLALGAGHANAQAAVPDTGYSMSFQCPETLPTKEAREEAASKFIAWAQAAHPDWTTVEFIEYRMKMLAQHHCDGTLESIQRKSVAASPSRSRYRCQKAASGTYFTDRAESGCAAVPLETGWTSFVARPRVLLDIKMASVTREPGGVTVWTHYYLAEPMETEEGWRYDEMKALSKFFCDQRQTMLLEGTYRLGRRVVHTTTKAEAYIEEVEPDTFSEDLYLKYCPA